MDFTDMERQVVDYCNNNDFVSAATIEDFREKLKQEDNLGTLAFALEKFVGTACPKCNEPGSFKWHFLGKLIHPDCGWSWYVGPGKYIVKQLKAVFVAGVGAGAGMTEPDKRGESGGFIGAIFGFFMGVAFRLPFALLMIPIQAIVSLVQKKPDTTQSNEAQTEEVS